MNCKRQNHRSISEYGSEIEKLAAKLAAAHVSMGTFASEAAATNIVQPIAVQAFVDGLKDPSTKFFIKARNPSTLNKAISDALECQSTPGASSHEENLIALWFSTPNATGNPFRGRGRRPGYRGFNQNRYMNSRSRGNGRGRGYYHQQPQYQQQQQYQPQYNNRGYPTRGYPNNNRGRGYPVNLAEANIPQNQQQQQQQQQQRPR